MPDLPVTAPEQALGAEGLSGRVVPRIIPISAQGPLRRFLSYNYRVAEMNISTLLPATTVGVSRTNLMALP